jgi:hypothetical protein
MASEIETAIDKVRPLTFLQALGVMFIGLKLAGEIDWHWGLVLIPIWMLIGDWLLLIFAKALAKYINERR